MNISHIYLDSLVPEDMLYHHHLIHCKNRLFPHHLLKNCKTSNKTFKKGKIFKVILHKNPGKQYEP